METKIFTVYDSKTQAYLPPFFTRSTGEALRMFETAANNQDHQFCQYSSDYTLFEIGSYDDLTAQITMLESKISLGTAIEYKTGALTPYDEVSLNEKEFLNDE